MVLAMASAMAAVIWPSEEWAVGPGGAAVLGIMWCGLPLLFAAQFELKWLALGLATALACAGSVWCWLQFRDNSSSTAVFVYFYGPLIGTPTATLFYFVPWFRR